MEFSMNVLKRKTFPKKRSKHKNVARITRKPCCRKETARSRSNPYRFKVSSPSIHYKFNSRQASKAQASQLQTYWRKTEFNANVD